MNEHDGRMVNSFRVSSHFHEFLLLCKTGIWSPFSYYYLVEFRGKKYQLFDGAFAQIFILFHQLVCSQYEDEP